MTKISQVFSIQAGNEEELQQASSEIGPISVAIDASQPSFQFYKDGILNYCHLTDLSISIIKTNKN